MRAILFLCYVFINHTALAQTTPPAGPPWHQACKNINGTPMRGVFKSSSSCSGKLQQFNTLVQTKPATEVLTWLQTNRNCVRYWAMLPWLAFMVNDQKMAKVAWVHQVSLTHERMIEGQTRRAPRLPFSEYFKKVRQLLVYGSTAKLSPANAEYVNQVIRKASQSTHYKSQMDRAYKTVGPICLYHKNLECKKAMKQALDWMYPRAWKSPKYPNEYMTFSMLPFYKLAFTDEKLQQYASKLALSLLDFVGSGRSQRIKIPELYEIGVKTFNGDMDRFWTFMAVLATRGSSWAGLHSIAHKETRPLFSSLMVVSATMGLLDTFWQSTGTSFSYAKGNENTCFQPKPYHYYMSGGYSYLLHRNGISKETSHLVARLLGAMYELSSTTWGRKPNAIFFGEPFAPVAMTARREIVHHYLGATLGIRGSYPQSFDNAFSSLISNSKPLPKMSKEEMKQKIRNQVTKWKYWTSLTGYYSLK